MKFELTNEIALETFLPVVLCHFSARSEARRLKNVVASFPMPPVADKTRGVKEECSTSLTRCSYHRYYRLTYVSL